MLRADLVKLGFVGFQSPDLDALASGKSAFEAHVLPLVQQMHDRLTSNTAVSEVTPERPVVLPERTSVSGLTSSLTLNRPLVIRARRPSERTAERFYGENDIVPDEFSILFDGSLFGALGRIERVPVQSSLGQVARELLREALELDEQNSQRVVLLQFIQICICSPYMQSRPMLQQICLP